MQSIDDAIAYVQVCYLSVDRLLLGNVPMMSCSRRLVTISNTSTSHCYKFTWHVTDECHAQVGLRYFSRIDLFVVKV